MAALHSRTTRKVAAWFVLLSLAVLVLAASWPSARSTDRLPVPASGIADFAISSLGQSAPRMADQSPSEAIPSPMQPLETVRARLLNAITPFARSAGPEARPFILSGSELSRERAIDCLASAMWYEAGSDSRGQQAVGQVVLNRVQHPAFPSTVCGVVFQGAQRSTGCQFTFTCDGSMRRIPSPLAFARTRIEARALLEGAVDPEVGLATHYHTDWVRPVWSEAMEKIAQVDTHLFFRWPGKRGQASAPLRRYAGDEPEIVQLAQLSPSHRLVSPPEAEAPAFSITLPEVRKAVAVAAGERTGVSQFSKSMPAQAGRTEGVFQLSVAPSGNGGAQAMAALDLCGDLSFCRVVGRLDPVLPQAGNAPGHVAFLYVRDRRTGVDRAFWNCEIFRRGNPAQCLTEKNRSWIAFDGNLRAESSPTMNLDS